MSYFTPMAALTLSVLFASLVHGQDTGEVIRVGMIGLDTSHCVKFTELMNDPNPKDGHAGCKVIAAYPKGSADIESSAKRIPLYTEQMKELGIEIVDSIDELLDRVDAVLLETNDGRLHLEQAMQVFKAGKPVFIDKPIAGSLTDTIAIFQAAEKYDTPVFSSSSLRYTQAAQSVRNGSIGRVLGCDAFSPCILEETHPDLFWYGIHGVEILYTAMGVGCETVTRASTDDADVVVGVWNDGRIGTFRGMRVGKKDYGGTAYGEKGHAPVGPNEGYDWMISEIVTFFKTGKPPIAAEETIEIYAFMEAADESKRRGGVPVSIKEVMEKASADVARRIKEVE